MLQKHAAATRAERYNNTLQKHAQNATKTRRVTAAQAHFFLMSMISCSLHTSPSML